MDKHEYKELRRRIGTWKKVAELTGENWRTIARRESGEIAVTRAAALTIQRLEPTWFAEMPPLPQLEGEEIRHVPGWEGYAVTDKGRVFSCRSRHSHPGFEFQAWTEKKAIKGTRGYWVVGFNHRGRVKQRKLYHVVLEAFVGPRPPGMQGCHYDDDPDNNTLENLRWDTPRANRLDMVRNGKFPDRNGHKHPMSRLTRTQAEEIKRRRLQGEKLMPIAEDFGICGATVSLIARGKTWKNLNNGKESKTT